MGRLRALVLAALLAMAAPAWADAELRVSLRSAEIEGAVVLGRVAVEGLGPVRLVARRQGTALVIHATAGDGATVARADAPVGLAQTPLYVPTPGGLVKITIYWGSPDGGSVGLSGQGAP